MRRKARTATLMALALLPSCSAVFQAKAAAARPTKPHAHDIARKPSPEPVALDRGSRRAPARASVASHPVAAPRHTGKAATQATKIAPASKHQALAGQRARDLHPAHIEPASRSRSGSGSTVKLRGTAHHPAPALGPAVRETPASVRVHTWLQQQKTAQRDAMQHADSRAQPRPAQALTQPQTHAPTHTSAHASADQQTASAPAPVERRETSTSRPPDFDEELPSALPSSQPVAIPEKLPFDTTSGLSRGSELPEWKSVQEEASTPVLLAALYDKRGHLIMPAPLKGSHEILLHQNQVADRDGLDRVKDDADLLEMRHKFKLVALPVNEALRIDERLPENRRYARVWTAQFLARMARDHYARFHTALQVNSAVRTVEFQQRLLLTNGNAAPADGDTASPHLTGQAVDIAKRGLPLAEIAWMRAYLAPLIQEGKIDVEEEFQQACFHVSVYKAYLPPGPKMNLATSHHAAPVAPLAAAIQ